MCELFLQTLLLWNLYYNYHAGCLCLALRHVYIIFSSRFSFLNWPWIFFANQRKLKSRHISVCFSMPTISKSCIVISGYFVRHWKVSNYTEDIITVISEQSSASVTIKHHILTLQTYSFKASLKHLSCYFWISSVNLCQSDTLHTVITDT